MSKTENRPEPQSLINQFMQNQTSMETDSFFREYTSQDAILKYTRATAGFGITYLLDHDYKKVYLEALSSLPQEAKRRGIRMLEFGCGAGMNLIHLMSVLNRAGIRVEKATGTDFSPVLIEAAKREARNYLGENYPPGLEFKVAKNETLFQDLSASAGPATVGGNFDLILGVNTIRYCHAAKKELDCARGILDLLVPGGVCVVIDMNNRYPCSAFKIRRRRSATCLHWRSTLRRFRKRASSCCVKSTSVGSLIRPADSYAGCLAR